MPIVTRAGKGSALTHAELDGNFVALDAAVRGAANAKAQARRRDRQLMLDGGALVQAPARANATAYAVGNVVRHSAGGLLICAGAGTSAGSEPAYSGVSTITDGTATWHPLGIRSKLLAAVEVPTVTTSATAPAGSTPYQINSGDALRAGNPFSQPCGTSFVFSSGVQVFLDTFYNDGSTTNTNGCGVGKRAWMQVLEVVTDDPLPGFGVWNLTGAPVFDLWVSDVDGGNARLIEEAPTPMLAGNPCWYIVNWAGARKLRRYRLEIRATGSYASNLYGLAVSAQSVAYAPPTTDSVRGLMICDSYATTISPGIANFNPNTYKLGARSLKYAGVRFAQVIQQASAGYVAGSAVWGGSSTTATVPLMLANNPGLSAWQPDVVAFACGYNDTPFSAQVQAAALLSFQRARALWPAAAIIAFGPQNGANNGGASVLAVDAAVSAAVAEMADANVFFQSTLVDPVLPWVSGAGRVGATSGTGNADFYNGADSNHPPIWAHEYHAQRYGYHIDRILSAVGR